VSANPEPFPQRPLAPHAGTSRISLRFAAAVVGIYLVALLVVAFAGALDAASRQVLWPVAATLASVAVLVLTIRWRDRFASYFEIGVVYAGVVALYAVVPPVIAMITHFEFSPDRDGRLSAGQPTPPQVASIIWWYAIYAAAFCAFYLLARPRHSLPIAPDRFRGWAVPISAAILLVVAKLFDVVVALLFGAPGGTYSESYLFARGLPVLWRQMANVFQGMEITLQIVILAALFCHYRRTKWIILIFVAALVCWTVLRRGARTDLAIVVIAAMQLRDLLVRRISFRAIAAAGVAGFALFLAISVLRTESAFRMPTAEELSVSGTDFEGIFDTAYDLKYLQQASGAFRGKPALLFADVAGVVPQQFLPFPKTSAALWYVITYYPTIFAEGGGLAFGVVAEAIVGYGAIELLLRGAFVGILLALLQRWYVRGRGGVIFMAFYVWMTVMSYQMCRNTTLSIVSQTLYRFVPAVVATLLLAAALRRGRQLRRRLLAS